MTGNILNIQYSVTDKVQKTISGILALLPNPCTTKPCLPGLALVIIGDDNVNYYLTRNDRFNIQDSGESNTMPGDKVIARGEIKRKQDIEGNTFTTIEFSLLRKVKT